MHFGVIIFVLSPFLYFDLYALGDDTSIRDLSCEPNICVLIHIRNKGQAGTVRYVKAVK